MPIRSASPAAFSERQPISPAQSSGAAAIGVERFGERKGVGGVDDDMAGEAAVARVAGELRRVAQILAPAGAIAAMAAGVAEPGRADPRANSQRHAGADRLDSADDLVSRHDRRLGVRQFAVDDMQIGAADAAGLDPQPRFARPRLGLGALLHDELLAGPPQHHRAHNGSIALLGWGLFRSFFGGAETALNRPRFRGAAFSRGREKAWSRLIQLQ